MNRYNFEIPVNSDERNSCELVALVIRKLYEPFYGEQPASCVCTEERINYRRQIGWNCLTDHKHWWASSIFYDGFKCKNYFDGKPDNVPHYIYHPCRGREDGEVLYFNNRLEHYDVMAYRIYSRWGYLKSSTIIDFDQNGQNGVSRTITYEYGDHGMPTRTVTTNSKNDSIVTENYYPSDYNVEVSNLGTLINHGIREKPIDSRKYVDNKLTDGTLIAYNDIGQPIEIYKAERELGSSLEIDTLKPYSYGEQKMSLAYDGNQNLVSLKPANNYESTYLWAYNNTFPVARMVNGSYDVVNAMMMNNVDQDFLEKLGLETEQASIDSLLEILQTEIEQNLPFAHLTTFKYDPLLGMISKTDPNEMALYYDYDGFGRLESISESTAGQAKQIRNTYRYNYSSSPFVSVNSDFINFDNEGGFADIQVSSNIDWNTASTENWLTVEPEQGSFNHSLAIHCMPNQGPERTAKIVLRGKHITKIIDVIQDAGSYLEVSNTLIWLDEHNTSKAFEITSNISWHIVQKYSGAQNWIEYYPKSGTGNSHISIEALAMPPNNVSWSAELEIRNSNEDVLAVVIIRIAN
jgi:hypothetical protein